jgi:hypothetical protein
VPAGTVFDSGLELLQFSVFLRSQSATIAAISYLLAFLAASLFPRISRQPFAGRPAALLVWPWINLLHPSSQMVLVACAVLNAAIIYAVLALLSVLLRRVQRRP